MFLHNPRSVKEKAINTCPAKDKKTCLCYGQTYFAGEATKHPRRQCDPMLCEYQLQLAEYHERQAEGFNHAAH